MIGRLTKYSPIFHQQVRTYVATSYSNTLQVPARIKHKQDTIHLQILTSNHIGPNLHGDVTLREYLFGSAWHTALKIDKKKGISYEESYVDFESKQAEMTFIPPEKIIFPENLFGIPQMLWEAFIGHLEHQELVNLLNLKQHRHLWPAYQYALSAPTAHITILRAQLIGQFHFLLSIALYHPDKIATQQNDIRNEFQFSRLKDIKHELDHGKFDKKEMVMLHDCFAGLVINKMRHCSNILDSCLLATIVSNYAKTALEPLNTKRKWGAINMLPSSVTEPTRFASSLKLANMINSMSARPGLLFFNSQAQWESHSCKEDSMDSRGKHYFDALFNDLIRRQVLMQAVASNACIDNELLQFVQEQFESLFLHKIAINKIKELQSYWQHNSHMIAAMKASQHRGRIWSPIISNITINGVTIRPLASADALIQHGKTMKHCVQSDTFVELCRSMQGDVLELVSEDGEMSTLDLRAGGRCNYYIQQHVGVGGNQKPSRLHLEAGIKFFEELQAGRIKVSKARQTEYLDKDAKHLYEFDYELDDLTTQERIYQIYKSKKMLPPRLIFANYLEMLETTQLVKTIDDTLKKIPEMMRLSDISV